MEMLWRFFYVKRMKILKLNSLLPAARDEFNFFINIHIVIYL